MAPNRSCRRRQRGLGIIEVLVALVVVSFGVLGLASLQLTGMKHSSAGYYRSKAMLFAENMATRMRINEPAVDALSYAGFDSNAAGFSCATPPDPYCHARVGSNAAVCDSVELAAFDQYSVACGDLGSAGVDNGVTSELPNGRLQIVCDDSPCLPDSLYAVTVSWDEGRASAQQDGGNTERRVQMRLRP